MLLKNSIKCNHCNDEIESKHRHDFIKCKCGKVAVDGGSDYHKVLFKNISDFTDTSIADNGTHELRREYLKWGINFDKDMSKLPKTIWKPVKDLETSHIQAILDNGFVSSNQFYKELFQTELKYRKL